MKSGKAARTEQIVPDRPRVRPPSRSDVRRLTAQMVDRIVARFQPERIVLFGSYARGTAGPDSDVDLLVVMPVAGSKLEKQVEIRVALHDIRFPKDVIVVTPEEWRAQRTIPGTVVRPARLEGRVLYERT